MILVTPDGHRTMNTFLGAAQHLPRERARRSADPRQRAILYLEGYLWDPETPRYAMVRAIEVARAGRAQGRLHACPTPSASTATATASTRCSTAAGSTSCSPTRRRSRRWPASAHLEEAVAASQDKVETLVVTRSEHGALAIRGGERADVPAEPIEKLVDTTGAGDLFAAGFLLGDARGNSLEQSLRLGAIAAAEVIQHYGARPEADLRALAGELARLS